MEARMVVAGIGYAGRAIAAEAVAHGFVVTGTTRDPVAASPPAGVALVAFAEAAAALRQATHLIVTAAPEQGGDPVLAAHGEAIAAAPALRWIGYLSTTGVYGDRDGGWVDEATTPAPGQARSVRRLEAEQAWRAVAVARGAALDLFRVGGIYGPGRSALEEVRAGVARRVVKPGHAFSRIHRDDIALAVVAAALRPDGQRVLHLVDDEPAPSAVVVEEAARLLGVAPPPAIPFEEARQRMSPMALSFWTENRRVANVITKQALGIAWRCPTYREGLRAILAAGDQG
ncbi:NAD(P)-dependent oxidoreductase [Falsiroseomonas bella]|uniref:NAD(P)-dependent oxidoreductase n=1 Tax=Falsiroseomonas bella TaxID=2184016 RepID=A0A317FBH8_9PROT|nr:NAD(P)-dependent oxidoreductase [Falsiroseomonas bella]PWS36451.1 NAD(P)-dependent oxidoreductase [Falsiroseomonas bella]